MKRLTLILIIVAGLCLLSAQNSVFDLNSSGDGGVSSSLFNPNRLRMSHSMGFAAGASSSGQGFYESRYTNHLKYEFNPRLSMNLDLNFVNFGSISRQQAFSFDLNDDNKTKLIPEFSLQYKPSNSFSIQFKYTNHRNLFPWMNRPSFWRE